MQVAAVDVELAPPTHESSSRRRRRRRRHRSSAAPLRRRAVDDHPLVRELKAALTIQASVRGKKIRGWSARVRAALAKDSGLRGKRIRMAQRQAERDLNAARNGAVKVRIIGGNTVVARIGRRCEDLSARISLSYSFASFSFVIFLVHWVFLWLSIVNDTDEYWHALLALTVAAYSSLYFTWSVSLELTLVKFCYRRRRLCVPEHGIRTAHLQRAALQVSPHQASAPP